jgi:hypothetical protein
MLVAIEVTIFCHLTKADLSPPKQFRQLRNVDRKAVGGSGPALHRLRRWSGIFWSLDELKARKLGCIHAVHDF